MTTYRVIAFDIDGEFARKSAPDFQAALVAAADMRARHPDKIIQVYSDDCDVDWDGLTNEEREQLMEVL